jgi:hypothetical protein
MWRMANHIAKCNVDYNAKYIDMTDLKIFTKNIPQSDPDSDLVNPNYKIIMIIDDCTRLPNEVVPTNILDDAIRH